ncbi:MAG: GEVED domain-containing protein [Bacteroidales bacterium]
MKKIGLNLLLLILFAGSLVYSIDLNGNGFSWETQIKLLNKEKDSVLFKPLFELLTSSTCPPCVEANEALDAIFENNTNEYAAIKYQMDWPGNGDPYYTEEGGVRRSYYGVNSIPDLYINSENLDPANSITQEIFDQYTSLMTTMQIELINASIDEENVIIIEAELTALADHDAGLIAHIVIVEKKTFNNVGTNGEMEFHYVMMKMLPNASGTELAALGIGSQVILSETFDMDETNMETPNDLAVVVFVQDDSDKSVIQSAMVDVDGSFDSYNVTYSIKDLFNNPIEGAPVFQENYGTILSDEYGLAIFEQTLTGTCDYSVNYAGLVPQSGTINVIDEDITQEVSLAHYTTLQETFNSGLPSNWTKNVGEGNFLYVSQGKVNFFRSNGNVEPVMLISPAIEINSTDTLIFEYGDIFNDPTLSFGVISNPYDPDSYVELESLDPENEWQTYELAMNSLTSSDTVVYFVWTIYSTIESSYQLDNVFIHKEGEIGLPIYTYGCSSSGMGFTDFALEQIENYNSGCADLNNIGWSQYLEMGPAQLFAGETYTITMASGSENVYASVWIDFNNDFTFTAEEMVIDNFLMEIPNLLYYVDLMIPAEAPNGLHTMRARTNGDGLCNDPCEEYYYGEAEDYWVFIGEEQILPPTNLTYEITDEDVVLQWDAPATEELTGYNIYYLHNSGSFDMLSNVTETTYTHAAPGTGLHQYYVTAVYFTGESDPSNTVEVLITGVHKQLVNKFHLYPNPLIGNTLNISVSNPDEVENLIIINASGQKILIKNILYNINHIDISSLSNGIYMVKVVFKDGSCQMKKLIVK